AFSITALKSVFIPKSVTLLEQTTSGSPFNRIPGRITVHADNPNYSSINGILYNKDTTVLIEAPKFLAGSFIVPETVTTIEIYAFQHDSLLTAIELPASLLGTQPIKNYAFAGCAALRQIIVKNQIPPTFTNTQYPFGSFTTATCTLYVPKGTIDAYKAANQWKIFTTVKETSLFYDLGYGYPSKISPNGKYLVITKGLLWENKENGDNSVISIPSEAGAELCDVNDNGDITANFKDNNYQVNGASITSGGVYKNGTWYSLGLGRYGSATGSTEAGSSVNAITADGWVFGMSHEKNNVAKVVPMVWKPDPVTGQYTDTLVYSFPEENLPIAERTQGSRFYDASADGTVASGWAVQASTFGSRQSIAWTSPSGYKIIAPETIGEAHDVSPNGKFITLTTNRKAALYDVEKDSLVVFGPQETTASAVSNDGTVVGFRSTTGDGRKGFIWSDKLGYIELKDFIEKYTPEIALSEDFQFSNDENDFYMDVPMTISGDGLVISGWRGAGVIRKTWVIALPAPLDLVSRPFALAATVDPQTRNKVVLNWSAPEETDAHLLDFYGIYRNESLIARIESDQTSYTDSDAPAGLVSYSVSAIYDYNTTTSTFRESNKSEPVQVGIVNNYDLPFYDGFDSGSYGTNYWETSPAAIANGWSFDAYDYKSALGISAVFVTVGDRSSYSHTLTSKPLDATEQTTVIASFLHEIAATSSILVGVKDTIYFEVADIQTTEWTTVKSYVLSSLHSWETETLDISDLVKGKVFRARFRAVSGANRNYMSFNLDEFAIATAPASAPEGVKASRTAENADVKVVWQDPSGSYGLTYAQSLKKSTTLGNEGIPFIAANKFEPADLTAYKDLYLTSISAYINAKGKPATVDTKLKLAVFAGANRIVAQEIESFEGNAWNTFALENPVKITRDATLSFGIEVTEHDPLTFPLSTDNLPGTTGKSDAFSEDGGATWQTLTDWRFPYSWLIIGNVRESAAASERTPNILGYEVYRGDEKINTGLTFGQTFVDTTLSSTEEAYYKVKTWSIFGGISGFSDPALVTTIVAIPSVPIEGITIYPNPASELIRIDGIFSTVTFFDLNGRKVLEARESPINLQSLNAGTYAVEITTPDGSKTRSKVIIRK
ncbi:MAG: T9SS type A sorting domain-containing protein, partial [Dysgonamonadaceae bacterium]|nr:T9SS type A sorting domain-containing protein [Dysgonamonadaceae bacterium]